MSQNTLAEDGERYSYFPGCTSHSTAVEYDLSTRAVLKAFGVELVEIEDWNCCGAAAVHSMNKLLSLCLPARNIAMAQKKDLELVVPCAGCFNMLKRTERALKTDPEMRREVESTIGFTYREDLKIRALIDMVVNGIGFGRIEEKVQKPLTGLKVACYYGCALVRHPKVTQLDDSENPQYLDTLISSLGATPVEWSFKTDCCGADLALTHGDVVVKLVNRIVEMAKEAGAECLVCSCGLCQINLEMRQDADTLGLPVFYFTELMGIALGLKGTQWWSKHLINPSTLLGSLNLQ
ncbi:MAG: CoB--CoM heterodisulfide reductase iron-sulfur subunit B family protein [Thermodesulfobacteriota bacterium]